MGSQVGLQGPEEIQAKQLIQDKYQLVTQITIHQYQPDSLEAKKEMNDLRYLQGMINAAKEEISFMRYVEACKEIEKEKIEARIEYEEKISQLEKARYETGLQLHDSKQKEVELQIQQRLNRSQKEELNKIEEKLREQIQELKERCVHIDAEIEKTKKAKTDIEKEIKIINDVGHKLFLEAIAEAIAENKEVVILYSNEFAKDPIAIRMDNFLLHAKTLMEVKHAQGVNLSSYPDELVYAADDFAKKEVIQSYAGKNLAPAERESAIVGHLSSQTYKDFVKDLADTTRKAVIKPERELSKAINQSAGLVEAAAEHDVRLTTLQEARAETQHQIALREVAVRQVTQIIRSGYAFEGELDFFAKAANGAVDLAAAVTVPASSIPAPAHDKVDLAAAPAPEPSIPEPANDPIIPDEPEEKSVRRGP